MATVEDALATQLRNIETATGRTIPEWTALLRASGRARHGEMVAWLKSEHGLTHGTANRLALVALAAESPATAARSGSASDPADELYSGAKAGLRPIHERLLHVIEGFGPGLEVAPKKGYVSLRRRTQMGLLKPAAKHVDVGLILPDSPVTSRLESAGSWNGMMTHRVRVDSVAAVDPELVAWLRAAWDRAG